ncbi:sigma-70 family RNA polymerase sigma factor [Dysgonomonas sp. 511]|uniref:sigma-70 family RNA polymerase sigma factor n=1 Tax=Dysgonomonas sp. 511 TaxID=2302930 RepID=UPI0013D652CF|nr:sigma-70 family RNA polymerase sigma factor [Dysgonomonas sp. 511]NDV79169.1 sigma-70 family RNA polymerase sigma factor [Dysgonomonas sp. 511]
MRRNDDSFLVTKLKEDNKLAFEVLYEKYSAKLYNSISLISYDQNLAKDITQSSFLTIWEKRNLLDPEKSISAYLFTIARNLLYKETERLVLKHKFVETTLTHSDIFEDNIVEDVNNTYLEDYINRLIEELAETPRKIFLMKKDDNLSTKEIADELGITERSVEAHFYRTLKILKEKLKDYMMLLF